MNDKKTFLKNTLLYGGLIMLILFTVITCIVVNYKIKQLDDLKDKNQQIEDAVGDEVSALFKEKNKIFSKNLLYFIDNGKNI